MHIKTSIKVSTILDFLIALIILSYAGPFASYRGILLLIGIVGVFFLLFSINKKKDRNKNLNAWVICIAYLSLNSILNLPSSLKYLMIVFVGYLVMRRDIDDSDCKVVFRIIEVVSFVEVVFIIIQRFFPNIFYPIAERWFFYSDQYAFVTHAGQYSKQYSGLCYEVSYASIVCFLGIIVRFVNILFEEKKYKKIINIIIIALSFLSIIYTGKRSIILAAPITMIIIYFLHTRRNLNAKRIIISILLSIVIIVFLPKIYNLVENILSRGKGTDIDWTSRTKFWTIAFEMFKENPFFGTGLNSFDIRFNRAGIRSIYYDFAGAHNSYFQVLGETGLLGLFIYLFAIISTLKKGISYVGSNLVTNKNILISVGIMISFMIYAISGNTLHQPQQLFSILWCASVIENLTIKNEDVMRIQ